MANRRLVDIGPLLNELEKDLDEEGDNPAVVCSDDAIADEIDDLESLPVIAPEDLRPVAHWMQHKKIMQVLIARIAERPLAHI